MYALANHGLSWPVMYEAASARRSVTARPSGSAGAGLIFELARKNRGAIGICLAGLSLSGIV